MTIRTLMLAIAFLVFGAAANAQDPSPSPRRSEPWVGPLKRATLRDSLKNPVGKPFESIDGRFRIDLPERSARYRPSQVFGQSATPRFGTIEWEFDEAEISIRFGMLPAGTASDASDVDRVRIISSLLRSGLNGNASQKADERNVDLGGLRAREIKTIADGRANISRVILYGDDYYVLAALLSTDVETEALIKKVFDSFATTR